MQVTPMRTVSGLPELAPVASQIEASALVSARLGAGGMAAILSQRTHRSAPCRIDRGQIVAQVRARNLTGSSYRYCSHLIRGAATASLADGAADVRLPVDKLHRPGLGCRTNCFGALQSVA